MNVWKDYQQATGLPEYRSGEVMSFQGLYSEIESPTGELFLARGKLVAIGDRALCENGTVIGEIPILEGATPTIVYV